MLIKSKPDNYFYMNKQIIDNINNNDELINNDLMFGYTNYKLIHLLVMSLSKLYVKDNDSEYVKLTKTEI